MDIERQISASDPSYTINVIHASMHASQLDLSLNRAWVSARDKRPRVRFDNFLPTQSQITHSPTCFRAAVCSAKILLLQVRASNMAEYASFYRLRCPARGNTVYPAEYESIPSHLLLLRWICSDVSPRLERCADMHTCMQ